LTALKVGDLGFELRRSANRQTMQITVERDGSLILFAPRSAPPRSWKNSSASGDSGSTRSSPKSRR
jgi:hypothetical protein